MSDRGKNPAKKKGRRLHFVTYSQLDANIFPTRKSFGTMLHREMDRGDSKAKVKYWACCMERHTDGGFHYHCVILMSDVKKWASIPDRIQDIYGIRVHFSDGRQEHESDYNTAYKYITKEDTDVYHSDDHPNLEDAKSPKTKHAMAANKRRHSSSTSLKFGESSASTSRNFKRPKLTEREVGNFILKHNIKTYTELLAVADEREEAGENDLSDFVWKRKEDWLRGCIKKAWDKSRAREEVAAIKKHDRLDLLIEAKTQTVCVCEGVWLKMAKEVLELNGIDEKEFAQAVYTNLELGRGKFRNVILVGGTNRAKTFLLKPMRLIYERFLFENPAGHKFGWGGCKDKTVFLLQDFRWNLELIKWSDFLLLLDEDETVKLPAPRNLYSEDIVIKNQISIFATSVAEIQQKMPYNNREHDRVREENKMMRSRWRVFRFDHEFAQEDQIKVQPCPHCFARLILQS
uniref:Uncharacterized protein n=1 Tax=Clytia hemisphaerica TaxID=252671 RepID=A0A7M5WTZ9_9CNID